MEYILCNNNFFEVLGQSCICQFFDSEIDSVLPHTHAFYELVLVNKGTIVHEINGIKQTLQPGNLVLIRPQDKHFYKSQERYILYNFMFSKEIADSLFLFMDNKKVTDHLINAQFPPLTKLTFIEQENFINEFNELATYNWTNKDMLELHFRKFLFSIISFFVVDCNKEQNGNPSWLEDTLMQMDLYENFTKGKKRFVELSGKSERQLNRVLKKQLGVTATEYVNNLRLIHVAKVLLTSRRSVIDVFLEAGFFNIGYAYKLFHKKYGSTPKQYREAHSLF